jgi:DNA polymerase III sliding clamp (beta) subunit (PCNA family)
MINLQLNRSYLQAVSLFCAGKTDRRYYLRGVHVELDAEHVRMIATDGKTMAAMQHKHISGFVTAQNAAPLNFTIPGDMLRAILRVKTKERFIDVDIAEGPDGSERELHLGTVGGTGFTGKTIDRAYPDWRRVFPKSVSGEAGFYDLEYLAKFAKINDAVRIGRPILRQNGPDSGAIVTMTNPDFIGVIMPMRVTEQNSQAFLADYTPKLVGDEQAA